MLDQGRMARAQRDELIAMTDRFCGAVRYLRLTQVQLGLLLDADASLATLALLGVHEPEPRMERRMRLTVDIYGLAQLVHGRTGAIRWVHRPCAELDGDEPIEAMLDGGDGLRRVRAVLVEACGRRGVDEA